MKQIPPDFLELLAKYVSFESVSTDAAFAPQIRATADWLQSYFEDRKFKVRILQGPTTNPVVTAKYWVSDTAKTILIYGHYDVQPADEKDGWFQYPFTLFEKDDRLNARGVVDNKGQTLSHMYAVSRLIKEGKLKYNVIFMLEGNEETGNVDMTDLVKEHADYLKADHIIISDGQIRGTTPTLEYQMRGGGNMTLTFKTSKEDIHSGLYGGAAPNAVMELVQFLSKIKDASGMILIPGFYDGLETLSLKQQQAGREMATLDMETILRETGTKILLGQYDFYNQVGFMPTIEFTGISGGYTGAGYKNIIPGSASVRINFRIPPSQDGAAIMEALKKFAATHIPKHVDYEVTGGGMWSGVVLDVNTPMAEHVKKLQTEVYGAEPIMAACGASIPVVSDFQKILGIDALLISLSNPDGRMHGVNENYTLDLLQKGLTFSYRFFSGE